jgi:N-acetylmuramoyl-L-alanine amidase
MRRLVTLSVFVAGLLVVAVQPAAAHPAPDLAGAVAAAPLAAHVNVAIQAGHWKSAELPDPLARLRTSTGAVGGGRTEPQVNLDIAQRTASLLRAQGLSVEILPATVPTGYSADLFISLHMDGNTSTRARGFKASTRWRSDVAALDAYLVDTLTSSYANVTGLPEDSSVTRAMRGYYAYSTYRGESYRLGSTTPAAILEMGFITSPADRAVVFAQPNRVAQGIVAGINAFYARLGQARRVQALAERAASVAPSDRSAVILSDSANLRADASDTARRLGTAVFGDSLSLLTAPNIRPTGQFDPRRGTQLVTGSGWYKVALPGTDTPAYISRDLVVVQQ